MVDIIEYKTCGTCCGFMQVTVEDNIIKDVVFVGGCNGNLGGIKNLVIGMSIDDVISKLQGIKCGTKSTSCPDQLAKCLIEYKQKSMVS